MNLYYFEKGAFVELLNKHKLHSKLFISYATSFNITTTILTVSETTSNINVANIPTIITNTDFNITVSITNIIVAINITNNTTATTITVTDAILNIINATNIAVIKY